MSQTSVIAASLIVAYIVFVTVNNELGCWLEILGLGSGKCCASIGAPIIGTAIGGVAVTGPTINVGGTTIRIPNVQFPIGGTQ